MRVAFVYNVRHETAGLDEVSQSEAEFDEPATIAAIHEAIEANGHTCIDVEADEDAFETLRGLRDSIDLVFNIAEGRRGQSREAQMPAMLEMLTSRLAFGFAHLRDRSRQGVTKKVWRFHGPDAPVPRLPRRHGRERGRRAAVSC
jgi:predicted RNA-binding Zn ribbon-like protein